MAKADIFADKNTSFQNVGWSDIQCFDGNNIGR